MLIYIYREKDIMKKLRASTEFWTATTCVAAAARHNCCAPLTAFALFSQLYTALKIIVQILYRIIKFTDYTISRY